MIEHHEVVQCGGNAVAFLAGLGGHFIFDGLLILLGAFGFSKMREKRKHGHGTCIEL